MASLKSKLDYMNVADCFLKVAIFKQIRSNVTVT